MKRDIHDYIYDILGSMRDIEEFTSGLDLEGFSNDRKTINAVIRSLEMIGEAAKNIPERTKRKYADVPWKRMAGMRDKLIHEYHGIDLEIVWTVVKKELPPLKPFIEKVAEDIKSGE